MVPAPEEECADLDGDSSPEDARKVRRRRYQGRAEAVHHRSEHPSDLGMTRMSLGNGEYSGEQRHCMQITHHQ